MPTRRPSVSRVLIFGVVFLLLGALIFAVVRWRQAATSSSRDLSSAIPFRPRVTYQSSNVLVTNTEGGPYLDASLHVYIGGDLYSAPLGTINPGETKQCPLRSLTNEKREQFNPGASGISELEVRAHFGGYAVHKDFPPPHE
jgi:hypothetical protein